MRSTAQRGTTFSGSFIGVKELHVCAALSQELSRALEVDDVGSDPGFLPGLREIVSEYKGSDVENLFSSFIRARRIAGNPVRYPQSLFKAKAIYACASSDSFPSPFLNTDVEYYCYCTDTASPDDPNELSFSKGEILYIVDKTGKWWQAETEDGARGSMSYFLTNSSACLLIPSCSYPVKLCSNRRQRTTGER